MGFDWDFILGDNSYDDLVDDAYRWQQQDDYDYNDDCDDNDDYADNDGDDGNDDYGDYEVCGDYEDYDELPAEPAVEPISDQETACLTVQEPVSVQMPAYSIVPELTPEDIALMDPDDLPLPF